MIYFFQDSLMNGKVKRTVFIMTTLRIVRFSMLLNMAMFMCLVLAGKTGQERLNQ